MVMEIESLLS